MFDKVNILWVLLFGGALLIVQLSQAAVENGCNECLSNEVYCATDTTYYFCLNGEKLPSQPLSCPKNTICSNSTEICVSSNDYDIYSGKVIACTPEDPSETCGATNTKCISTYFCLSPTRYGRCIEGKTSAVFSCDKGLYCSDDIYRQQGQKDICSPKCVLDYFKYEASCQAYSLVDLCWDAAEAGKTSTYYYMANPNVPNCKSYIQCDHFGFNMTATATTCSGSLAYDPISEYCSSSYKCPQTLLIGN